MKTYGGGHTESHTDWPEPLASTGIWNVGALALPATMLSICSAAVFAMVFGFLQLGGARQELFVVKSPVAAIVGGIAAFISWIIVYRCRHRPGRLWPRLWGLALASLNSAIAVLALIFPDRSWSLALAVAGLSAAMALTPRLGKLRPDSVWVQRVGPLSLAIVLVMVPSSCAVRSAIAKNTEDRVERRIQQFRLWTEKVEEVTSFEWSRMEESPEVATKKLGKLAQLSFRGEIDDTALWRSVDTLGKNMELASAMQGLTAAVVAGLAPDRGPRVSDLKEAAIRWNDQDKRWEAYGQFPRLSEITGSYRHELGRLFGELASRDESGTFVSLVDYRQHYGSQRELLRGHLNETTKSWTDNWAAFEVPQHAELIGRERVPLYDVLQAPFVNSEAGTFSPGQLGQLMSLPLQRTKALAQGVAGCEGGSSFSGETSPAQAAPKAPGCHCQNYEERNREYFRLDCYSYSPRQTGTGAELRIEMRLVYQAGGPRRRLRGDSLPAEIYFHFLIPEGAERDGFGEEVMTALAAAARDPQKTRVYSADKGGSVAGGFTVERSGRVSRVYRPKVVGLRGLTPEPNALQVRVVPKGSEGMAGG
ncbi:MAG TPA: hypothetical protein VGQ76_14230 [Thermoanaerobaculia bacterium]|jgi:hypothetical protein|nr:hypothetical protein [Thermoanaerobaculia bacterium]